ncbi:10268_t:CDS:2, partial [Racocetra persica]
KHQAWILSPEPEPNSPSTAPEGAIEKEKERRWALLGKYLSQYVTYTNPTTAWLLNDDMTGRLTKTFFSTITNNENLGGVRLIRGYQEVKRFAFQKSNEDTAKKKKEEAETVTRSIPPLDAQQRDIKLETMETQDYENEESEGEERVIDHLILVIHGIGQKLSERIEWLHFVNDVNTLRKTLKSIFANHTPETSQNSAKSGSSTSSSRRNSTLSDRFSQGKNGIQVLPIQWRQEIKFGMAADEENFQRDLGLPKAAEEGKTTLGEVTLEGVPTLRLLLSDVLMDEIMINTVTNEANRIYNLFIQRNPKFVENGGKVSLYGHSLGSVLAFDVLCHQPPIPPSTGEIAPTSGTKHESYAKLDFPVQNFFSAGSP